MPAGDTPEEMKAAYCEVARRGIDMLLEHARLCPVCLLHGVDRCKLGDAMRRVIEKGCELGLVKKT